MQEGLGWPIRNLQPLGVGAAKELQIVAITKLLRIVATTVTLLLNPSSSSSSSSAEMTEDRAMAEIKQTRNHSNIVQIIRNR